MKIFSMEYWLSRLTPQTQSALIRKISSLFQSCSLPENLWTALIQLWAALKTKFPELRISAEQCCLSADFLWNSADSKLNSADFWCIQKDNFWLFFVFFRNFQKYFSFEAHITDFQRNVQKRTEQQKFSHSIFFQAWDKPTTRKVAYSAKTQVTKLIWFNFSKAFSHVVGWTFKLIWNSLSFWCHFTEDWGNLHVAKIEYEECHFDDHFKRFHHFRLRCHNLIFPSICVNIRANSE